MNLMKFKFELPKANAELKKVLLPQNMKIVTPDLCKTKKNLQMIGSAIGIN